MTISQLDELSVVPMPSADVASSLGQLLADTYTLYLKTQNFHWNVTGIHFPILHKMFEEQYLELAVAIDDIAERIRALGYFAPGSYAEFLEITTIPEAYVRISGEDMVTVLAKDHNIVADTSKDVFFNADAAGDQPTAELATSRQNVHEKFAWMLNSTVT